MATSKIENPNQKETGSIERHSNIGSSGTLESKNLYKVGNTVYGCARLYSFSHKANDFFFVIPEGFRPSTKTSVSAHFLLDTNSMIPVYADINTDGTVFVAYSNYSTATQVCFEGAWSIV